MSQRLHWSARWLLLGLLVFAPIAFGGRPDWAWVTLQLGLLVCLVLWLAGQLTSGWRIALPFPAAWFAVAFCALVLFQVAPLPETAVRSLSPSTASLWQEVNGGVAVAAGERIDALSLGRLSLVPAYSWVLLRWVFTLAGTVVMTVHVFHGRAPIRLLVLTLLVAATANVLYAFAEVLSGHEHVLGVPKEDHLGNLTGTFTNRNHFAGYVELVLAFCLGLAYHELSRHERHAKPEDAPEAATQPPERKGLNLLLLSIALLVLGLLFSQSRGGLLSATLAALLFFGLLARKRRRAAERVLFFVLLPLSLASLLWVHPLLTRALSGGAGGRLEVWRDVASLFERFPIWGGGMGSFGNLFPLFQTSHLHLFWDHAHNDYIELLSETGVAGLALVGVGFVLYYRALLAGLRRRRNSFAVGIGAGSLMATTALLVHSAFDYNLRVPANALLFAVGMGIGLAAIRISRRRPDDEPPPELLRPQGATRWLTLGLLVLCGALLYSTIQDARGAYFFSRFQHKAGDVLDDEVLSKAKLDETLAYGRRAARTGSATAARHYAIGSFYAELFNQLRVRPSLSQYERMLLERSELVADQAQSNYERARLLAPLEPFYHFLIAWSDAPPYRDWLGEPPQQQAEAIRDAEVNASLSLRPRSAVYQLYAGEYWVKRYKQAHGGGDQGLALRVQQQLTDALSRTLTLDPQRAPEVFASLEEARGGADLLFSVLTGYPDAQGAYSGYFSERDDFEGYLLARGAEEYVSRSKAARLLDESETVLRSAPERAILLLDQVEEGIGQSHGYLPYLLSLDPSLRDSTARPPPPAVPTLRARLALLRGILLLRRGEVLPALEQFQTVAAPSGPPDPEARSLQEALRAQLLTLENLPPDASLIRDILLVLVNEALTSHQESAGRCSALADRLVPGFRLPVGAEVYREALYRCGLAYLALGRPAQAQRYFFLSDSLGEPDVRILLAQARVYSEFDKPDQAKQLTRAAQQLATRRIAKSDLKGLYQDGQMYSNGEVRAPVVLLGGEGLLTVSARGTPAENEWPWMVTTLDGRVLGVVRVESAEPKPYSFRYQSEPGPHELAIEFVNDRYNPARGEDRNLFVDEIRITYSADAID